ncbi:hypothetical protein LINPERPRIM_LOCUS849 [Linum perenne]
MFWVHFSRIRVNGVTRARCKYCRKLLSVDSNSGTYHLRNHHKTCLQKKIHDGPQRVLGANYLPKGKAQLIAIEYNYEVSKKMLCSMILLHEYPLSIVDHIVCLGIGRFRSNRTDYRRSPSSSWAETRNRGQTRFQIGQNCSKSILIRSFRF